MKKIFLMILCLTFCYGMTGLAIEQKAGQPITDFLTQLKSRYEGVQDYTATMRLENFESEYKLQKQKIWFKKPGYLLIKQLGPFKKGAVLAIYPDGKIKGHLGGFLSFAVVSLDKDDENMYGVTGDSALTTDYGQILNIAMGKFDRVKTFSITEYTDKGKKYQVLETTYDSAIDRLKLIVDKRSQLIVGLERYKGKKLIHRIQWFDVKTNVGLKTSLFDL